ncbi:hypothetical protein C4559_06565 [Candidatus Microgenomates bacterium]|nr:MAG: hypothetical protein C4559_06565 [Candidatus Microgenomates bacterium]
MNKLLSGIIAGLIFGIIDVLLMVPLPIENKLTAMIASFIGRFAIGFFIAATDVPVPFWLKGILVGLLLSLPDAIITKTYAPIIGIGIVGGLIIGLILGRLQA